LNDGAAKLAAAANLAAGGAQQFGSGLNATSQGASQLTAGAEAFGNGLNTLDAGSAQISNGSGQLSSGLAGVTAGLKAALPNLTPGDQAIVGSLIAQLDYISGQYTSLDSGIQNYTGGVNTLAQQYGGISAGLNELSNGVNALNQNYGALSNGLNQLSGGVTELNSGSQKLAAGTQELYGGVRDMPQTMQTKIDEFIAGYDFSGFDPHSFLSADNSKVSLVQFVIKTPDIELPADDDASSEVPAEQSFWDRVLALFG
jgi:X-X-X-Leu-X-X-Gly heptad repeat protein